MHFGAMYGAGPMGPGGAMTGMPAMDMFGAGPVPSGRETNDSVRFIQKLGSGVFGEVWKAEYQGELVAAKVTQCPTGFRDEEVALLRRAQGKHAVRLIAEEHNTPKGTAIIMELCEGSLIDRMQRLSACGEPRCEERFLLELCAILEGLAALHDQGIMFGDLKPDNLLVQGDRILFADFGDARDMKTERRARSVHEEAWGSPMYHARPDVMRQKLSCASDMWMFAQTAIHMWEGQTAQANPSPLPEELPLRELFEACHREEPSRRPTAHEALQMCREWVNLGSSTASPPIWRSSSSRSPSKSPPGSPTKRSSPPRRASLSESPTRSDGSLSPTSFQSYRRRRSLPGPVSGDYRFDGSATPRRDEAEWEAGFVPSWDTWQGGWMIPPPRPPMFSAW